MKMPPKSTKNFDFWAENVLLHTLMDRQKYNTMDIVMLMFKNLWWKSALQGPF